MSMPPEELKSWLKSILYRELLIFGRRLTAKTFDKFVAGLARGYYDYPERFLFEAVEEMLYEYKKTGKGDEKQPRGIGL